MTVIIRPTERNVTVQARPRQVSVEAVAARGPQGERGPAGDGGVTYEQVTPVSTATINHNLGRRVQVEVFDHTGQQVLCQVTRLNDNQVKLDFNTPMAFTATII